MSRLNNEQMKALVAAFMDRVTSGAPVDEAWRSRTAAAAPALPEHPTPAQIEAWTELAGMLQDQDVMREFEAGISAFWEDARDADAYRAAAVDGYRTAVDAVARGVAPTDAEGVAAGRAWLDASARAMGRVPDATFVQWLQDQYAAGGSRARFQELLAVLQGETRDAEASRAWRWLIDAARAAAPSGQ